jgi:hypothetical protein
MLTVAAVTHTESNVVAVSEFVFSQQKGGMV